MKEFLTNNWQKVLLCLFLFLFIILSIGSSINESLTYDEIVYLQEGRQALLQHTFTIDPYNPPLIKELAALPYLFTKSFYTIPLFHIHYPLAAKIVVLLLGIGVLLATYFLTKKYVGKIEAFFAVGLLSFEPTFLANAHIVTLDMGITLFFLIAFCLLIALFKQSTTSRKIALAIVSGLGLATKLSFIPYFVLSAIGIVWYFYGKSVLKKVWNKKSEIILLSITSLFIVWLVYWFQVSPIIKQRKDDSRTSQKIISFAIKHHVPFLGQTVQMAERQGVPLGDFLAINKNTILRKPAASCFFLGTYYSSCLPYFLPINLLLKLPLPLLIFFFSSFIFVIANKQQRKKVEVFVIPLLVILFIGSFSKMQPLVRYVLPAYPFIAIIAASSVQFWQKNIARKIIFASLCFWYVMSTVSAFPHFLSYANEMAGFPEQRFELLTDSNLDWGQSLPDVSTFIKKNKPTSVMFSYFGRDNGDWYGLQGDKQYMSYKSPDICAFHAIHMQDVTGKKYSLISSSNWYSCGYYKEKRFAKNKIQGILGDTILVF